MPEDGPGPSSSGGGFLASRLALAARMRSSRAVLPATPSTLASLAMLTAPKHTALSPRQVASILATRQLTPIGDHSLKNSGGSWPAGLLIRSESFGRSASG
jgi:hypothetical protein